MTKALPMLIRASGQAFPKARLADFNLRGRMIRRGLALRPALEPFLTARSGTAAGFLMVERPQTLGALIWPYQNARWEAAERLARIAAHCREMDRLGGPFPFSTEARLVLADLGARHPDLRLVMDQPRWFMREGGLVINLFEGSFRAYSLAFSLLEDDDGARVAYIGALQGRNSDAALDLYRQLTRALYGVRPRDFLIEVLRMLTRPMGIERTLAVADLARHHHHAFFGVKPTETQDYDAIWAERGGVRLSEDTWELPVTAARRPLEEIKSKKRSLYRQRYAFLDALAAELAETLPGLEPVEFADS